MSDEKNETLDGTEQEKPVVVEVEKVELAVNFEQFSDEYILDYLNNEIANIHVQADGVLIFIDHHFLEIILANKLVSEMLTSKQRKWSKIKTNAYNVSALTPAVAGSTVAIVSTNPLFFAPGGLFSLALCAFGIAAYHRKKEKKVSASLSKGVFNYAIDEVSPKVKNWLQEFYSIEVTEKTLKRVVSSMLTWHTVSFTSVNGIDYSLTGNDEDWWVELKKNQSYTRLATVGNVGELPFAPTTMVTHKIEAKFESETEKLFSRKVALLDKQKLSVESRHHLKAVMSEAEKILQAVSVLKELGDDTYEEKSEAAFILLIEEIDRITAEKIQEEHFNLAVSERFVAERYRKPLKVS